MQVCFGVSKTLAMVDGVQFVVLYGNPTCLSMQPRGQPVYTGSPGKWLLMVCVLLFNCGGIQRLTQPDVPL